MNNKQSRTCSYNSFVSHAPICNLHSKVWSWECRAKKLCLIFTYSMVKQDIQNSCYTTVNRYCHWSFTIRNFRDLGTCSITNNLWGDVIIVTMQHLLVWNTMRDVSEANMLTGAARSAGVFHTHSQISIPAMGHSGKSPPGHPGTLQWLLTA